MAGGGVDAGAFMCTSVALGAARATPGSGTALCGCVRRAAPGLRPAPTLGPDRALAKRKADAYGDHQYDRATHETRDARAGFTAGQPGGRFAPPQSLLPRPAADLKP